MPGSTAPASRAARPASQLAYGRGPVADGRPALRVVLAGGAAHSRIGRATQLAPEQRFAGVGVLARGGDLARPGEAAHQKLVGGVVEPVQRERARGERGPVERDAGGQGLERRIPQHGLAQAGKAPALHQQPGLEVRAGAGIDTLEQLASRERGIGVARSEREHVHASVRRQHQRQGIPAQRHVGPQRSAQLRQRPAQRPERVGGISEDQPRQPRPRHRSLGQQQIGEHRPGLVATRRSGGSVGVRYLRRPEQADHKRRHDLTIVDRDVDLRHGGVR